MVYAHANEIRAGPTQISRVLSGLQIFCCRFGFSPLSLSLSLNPLLLATALSLLVKVSAAPVALGEKDEV